MRNLIKLLLLAVTAVTASGCLPAGKGAIAQQSADAQALTEKFLTSELFTGSTIAIKVVDLNSGEELISHQPALTVVPASVQKLVTTAAALEILSPEYAFETTLDYTGEVNEEGTLLGGLFITGGGDPAFGSPNFADHYGDVMNKFAEAIVSAGIKKVDGNVIGDASLFGATIIPGTWLWEDIGNYYGASPSGLNIYDNSYEITFSTQKQPGTPAKITKINPEIPGLTFDNRVLAAADNRDNAFIYGSYLDGKRLISGTIPAGRSAFTIKGSVPDPAFLAAHQLVQTLKNVQVEINGVAISEFENKNPEDRTTLLRIQSPRLSEIIHLANSKSQNLYTDALLMHISATTGEPSLKNGALFLKSFWEERGMCGSGMFLVDGSGHSRTNGLTADQIIFILKYMHDESEHWEVFRRSLAVSGVSGTLANFGNGTLLEKNFTAKSGSMSRVVSYAGYLTTASGSELALVLIINNFEASSSAVRNKIVEYLVDIAEAF